MDLRLPQSPPAQTFETPPKALPLPPETHPPGQQSSSQNPAGKTLPENDPPGRPRPGSRAQSENTGLSPKPSAAVYTAEAPGAVHKICLYTFGMAQDNLWLPPERKKKESASESPQIPAPSFSAAKIPAPGPGTKCYPAPCCCADPDNGISGAPPPWSPGRSSPQKATDGKPFPALESPGPPAQWFRWTAWGYKYPHCAFPPLPAR